MEKICDYVPQSSLNVPNTAMQMSDLLRSYDGKEKDGGKKEENISWPSISKQS